MGFILQDCDVRVLVTSAERLAVLAPMLGRLPSLRCVVTTESVEQSRIRVLPSQVRRCSGPIFSKVLQPPAIA